MLNLRNYIFFIECNCVDMSLNCDEMGKLAL